MVGAFAVTVLIAVNVAFTSAFTWTNCSPDDSPLQITKITVSPERMTFPGQVTVSMEAVITEPISESSLELTVNALNEDGEPNKMPCLMNLGSCTYDNLCTVLDEMIEDNWAGMMAEVGQQVKDAMVMYDLGTLDCPIAPRTISLVDAVFDIPEMPSLLSSLVNGDFSTHVEVTNKDSGNVILCMDVEMSLGDEECEGILCGLLGGK